jgi:carbon monoxide dehydrogenase subunit G
MSSIRREFVVKASPATVWDAMRDVGALHTRLVPGFVTDCTLEGNVRTVTFVNGMVAREVIIDVSDAERRVVWSATGGPLTHHNSSVQVFDDAGGGSRIVWVTDLLPDKMAATVTGMVEAGLAAMKKVFA